MVELSAGDVIAGYRVDAVAGHGGMGVVYRATDITLERPVALKLIAPELAQDQSFRERFKRESRLAASIRHANVITVFRAGEEEEQLFIAMDYIDGTDLRSLIASQGMLDPAGAADIVAQVASALDAAHAKGLVHRDVKPANVLIADDGGRSHAYLTDFGLTKNVASETGMTKTGVVMGTIDYVAPEQITGVRVDARADVYSLGCVLYEALTGQVPYPRDTSLATMYAHAEEPPPTPSSTRPELPASFDQVVRRALAKDPADRYPSAGDLGRAAVAAVADALPHGAERSVAVGAAAPLDATVPSPAPPTVAAAAPRARRRVPLRVLGAAAVLLAGLAVALTLILGGGGSSGPTPLSKNAYQDGILDAFRPTTVAVTNADKEIPEHVSSGSASIRAGNALTRVRKSYDRLLVRLRRMVPPADVTDLHRQLIAVVGTVRADIADAGAAADAVNDRDYRGARTRFTKDSNLLDPIGRKFKARGYSRIGEQVSS
jgi:Protein kinase domain